MLRSSLCASAIALMTFTQPSWSLTAEEAWDAIQAMSADFGQTVTVGSTSKSGNVLTLSDLSYLLESPEAKVTGETAQMVITEQADGSVTVTGSDRTDLMIIGSSELGADFTAKLDYQHPDWSMSGTDAGGGVTFTLSAPTIGLTLTEAMDGDKAFPLNMTFTASGLSGQYGRTGGLSPTVTQSYQAASLTGSVNGRDPDTNGTFQMELDLASLAGALTSTGGSLYASDDIAETLRSGVSAQGSITTGPFSMDLDVQEPNETVDMTFSAASTVGSGGINKDQVNYNIDYNGLNLDLSGSEIPLPVLQAAIQRFGVNFLMPLSKGDATKPFVLKATLEGAKIGDPIWNLFDPASILPRDPASLVVSLAGQAKVLVDMLDPNAAMLGAPAELHALSITEVLLDVAGAKLTGDGGFTFDNTDMTTFDGIPRPMGSLNVKLVGGNGLLDKLVQMGLLPQDQAMGVRMMSGMFLRPGDGEDTLTSEIQVTPQGQVLANGTPLPF